MATNDPGRIFLTELAAYMLTVKNINNVFALAGDPLEGDQIVLVPYGGLGRDFVMSNVEKNFRFQATIFAATMEDCYDLANDFQKNACLPPEHGYAFTSTVHYIEAIDDPNEPYENESGGYQTTCNFEVKLKL